MPGRTDLPSYSEPIFWLEERSDSVGIRDVVYAAVGVVLTVDARASAAAALAAGSTADAEVLYIGHTTRDVSARVCSRFGTRWRAQRIGDRRLLVAWWRPLGSLREAEASEIARLRPTLNDQRQVRGHVLGQVHGHVAGESAS